MVSSSFSGFEPETLAFFRELALNNNKVWFEAHRDDYERHVLTPAKEFVAAMGEQLRPLTPGVIADPRPNQSLFRINRDTRFSRDKSPYKTHLGLWLWEGSGKRMECSGFYFHMEPNLVMIAAGLYHFPKHILELYREAVLDTKRGAALSRIVSRIDVMDGVGLGGTFYKKTPRGLDSKHPRARFLLHNGLYAYWEDVDPEVMLSDQAVDFCLEQVRKMLPVHQWLVKVIEGV